jgi:hypothetical protein
VEIHSQLVSGTQQERLVIASREIDGETFMHLAFNPVHGLAQIVDAFN